MNGAGWGGERGIGAFGLIALLLGVAIVVALAVAVVPRVTGAGGGNAAGTAPAGKAAPPTERAESTACMNNLSQLRQALVMYQTANEALPANLSALQAEGVTAELLVCPVGGASYAYQYDASSGRVACRYPGHEQY
ncbi:MAG: hypothetical protein GX774_18280 [Armatimonadetes bacterium]|jgi:hypothetical protein|nr:hypothetical protein [Armatimonadota bacterium]